MDINNDKCADLESDQPLDDCIDGLNEKLLELLKNPPTNIKTHQKLATPTDYLKIDNEKNEDKNDADNESNACPANMLCQFKQGVVKTGTIALKHLSQYLTPIGVFWDIENCPVARGKSAATVAQTIRGRFFKGYKEAEFIVVCDVYKESKLIIQELNDAQVNLIHVGSTYKNAADEKLKQSIRRFADIHGSPSAILLISSDVNFAADLSDLRHRKKIHIILLHNNSSPALRLCANEVYSFNKLMEPLSWRGPSKTSEINDLIVTNLPKERTLGEIKKRLKRLSENCGGRIISIDHDSAIIRFGLSDLAERAQKRMDGETVFDRKITVKSFKERDNRKAKESVSALDLTTEASMPTGSPLQMYSAHSAIGVRSLPGTPQYNSSPPVVAGSGSLGGVPPSGPNNSYSGNQHCRMMQPAGPMYLNRSFANNIDSTYHRSLPELQRGHPQVVWPVAGMQYGRSWEESKVDRQQKYSRRVLPPQRTDPSHFQIPPTTPDGMRRIRGAHSTLNHAAPEWNMPRAAGYCPPPPAASSAFTTANFTQNTFKRRSSSPLYANQGRDGGQWNGQGQHVQPMRNARTPSPYGSAGLHPTNQQLCRTSPYTHSESDSDEVEKFFNPITTRSTCPTANNPVTPIELQVTNLDQNIEPKEMRRILSCIFMEHVQVIHVSVFMQSDGNFAASIKVPSLQEAQYAISQLHRRKIGYKRILIAYAHTGGPNPQLVRSQIVMLLQEVPGHKLPLFKFREMYESRFMISISVSELYKMKDVCLVTEDPNGRMVSLNPDHRNTPSPCITNTSQDTPLDLPFCTIHMQKPVSDKGWAEQEMAALPNVMITLSFLENAMNSLLACHGGSMPLPGLPTCWQEVFGEVMNIEEEGVPLEHLVSCLPSIELRQGNGSVKYLVWVGRKTPTENHEEIKCVSPPLANQLALFSRELVDLLKTAPHCQLPFNRFIPAYHHHFGRQCRVADYGFTKLIDLLEALTTTVQVMGEGNKRVVTLSHRAQVRRFTSDLLRVLKAQASKQIKLSEFPNVYTRVIGKQWDIVDYGLCHIDDILKEVSENTVVVTECGFNDKLISIPKREQTPEEIERTKQFAVEVVELLRHAPQCSMLFNKFVPSYHHHFGHQCRVSDYGFTKLIELFEAIPHVVNIEDTVSGERRISLTEKEGLRVLGEQVAKLVVKNRGRIAVGSIGQAFLHHYGYMLRPEMFKCSSMVELMRKLDDVLEIIENANGTFVQTFDRSYLLQLRLQCRRILMDQPQHEMPVKEFQKIYNEYYGSACNLKELKEELFGSVEFSGNVDHEVIQLTPLQSLACNLYKLLMKHNGKLALQKLEPFYQKTYGNSLCAAQYGFSTLTALLQSLACTLVLRETRNKKKNIYLNAKLALVGIPLPPTWSSPNNDKNSSTESLLDESAKVENPEISVSDQYLGKDAWTDKTSNNFWRKDSWGNSETSGLNWPILESTSEDFFKNLTTPIVKNHAKPPKPDTPPDDDDDEVVATVPNDGWKSSLWDTPPNFSQDVSSVEVPQIHLPNWSRIEDEETVSSLLSPTKSLLPAAANPLDLKTSPYYATKHLVIAPHPSELPLPSSLSIAPRRGLHSNDEALDSRLLGNSIEVHSPTNSENCSISESEASDLLNATPSKKIFGGKRRLAAQFNQPMD